VVFTRSRKFVRDASRSAPPKLPAFSRPRIGPCFAISESDALKKVYDHVDWLEGPRSIDKSSADVDARIKNFWTKGRVK